MIFKRNQKSAGWLVVFLGNPGARFEGTRHNVGFMTADALSQKLGVKIDRVKYKALVRLVDIGNESVLLMKPQTFMNLSGDAVREAMNFYKIPTEHILVISDDVSLPVGKLRVRRSGSAGGHNGLKDIIAKCGGDGFPRIKVGVGDKPHPDYDMADWVLSRFIGDDAKKISEATKRAADAVEVLITQGVDKAMAKYN